VAVSSYPSPSRPFQWIFLPKTDRSVSASRLTFFPAQDPPTSPRTVRKEFCKRSFPLKTYRFLGRVSQTFEALLLMFPPTILGTFFPDFWLTTRFQSGGSHEVNCSFSPTSQVFCTVQPCSQLLIFPREHSSSGTIVLN